MLFWIITTGLMLVVAAVLMGARGRDQTDARAAAGGDLGVCRGQRRDVGVSGTELTAAGLP